MIENRNQNKVVEKQWKFNDQLRSIDFVLLWEESKSAIDGEEDAHAVMRHTYESNLREEGLELEEEYIQDKGFHFVKIHASFEVLKRYAEILQLRMPMKELGTSALRGSYSANLCFDFKSWAFRELFVDKTVFPDVQERHTAIYSRDKEYLFDSEDPEFFIPANKSRIVKFILDRTCFLESEDNEVFSFGIERLLNSSVYKAAYPLHDGDLTTPDCIRYNLNKHWASLRMWYRYQPIDYIKNYFGVKIGMYFAWLGFYTYMLLPASVVGLSCVFVSAFLLPRNKPTEDICSKKFNPTMCPLCDHFCDYWELSGTCTYAKIEFLFDNGFTVVFAVFMSFWAAFFLEMWKRYSAEITHRWDLTGFDSEDQQPRPQYLARLFSLDEDKKVKHKLNVITNIVEPNVPFWKIKFPASILSFSVVFLLIILALVALLGVMLYRMSVMAALSVYGESVTSFAIIITTATAACINLICIFFFKWVYSKLAMCLTELEFHRTQTEFDDSLTLKMYSLQFVNYYGSIFYIAFFKGNLVGTPNGYNRMIGYRMEECGLGGCLLELSIQLAIIMVGKQAINSFFEMGKPIIKKWWKSLGSRRINVDQNDSHQLEKDLKLMEWGSQALFPEYLEMVLQYGFVTIFVSAFPLAPLFALINNVLETRLDAKKLLVYHRRPVAQRVQNIGVWFKILDTISKLAVVSNGVIIGFTSEFVPHMVYSLTVSHDHSLTGYMNHSLAYMSVNDLDMTGRRPKTNLEYCRYHGHREPPWSSNKYEPTKMFWTVLAARFAFVVFFENLVVILVLAVKWIIPDVPAGLADQIKKENYLTKEIIITQETLKARNIPLFALSNKESINKLLLYRHNSQGITKIKKPKHERHKNKTNHESRRRKNDPDGPRKHREPDPDIT